MNRKKVKPRYQVQIDDSTMVSNQEMRALKLAILQRVCPPYRIPLFNQLSQIAGMEALLFIGSDIPDGKVKNALEMKGVRFIRLRTHFLRLGTRILPWHVGLVRELRKFKPDVVLCEGESHFLGYLQAIFYRVFFNWRVALIHWCFISLPGWKTVGGMGIRAWIKVFFRKFFDAFVVYSSFSKDCLLKLGQPREKIFIATNVGDVQRFLLLSEKYTESKEEARAKLKLPNRFTVLFAGTLHENKKPGMLLELSTKSALKELILHKNQ